MKTKYFLSAVVIAGLMLTAGGALAQLQETPSVPNAPAEVSLPTPTVLPDSPFYFIGRFFEETRLFFTFGAEARARAHLRIAEKRLAEAQALAKRKEEKSQKLADKVMEKYQKRMAKVQRETEKTDEQTAEKLAGAYLKHIQVLNRVMEKAPERARPGIERALENARRLRERKIEGRGLEPAEGQPIPPKPEKRPVKIFEPGDDGSIICPMIYDPVCGVNGQTYSNRCEAENQNKVKVAYRGECKLSKKPTVSYAVIAQTHSEPPKFIYGFSPATLTVKKGAEVIFKNNGDREVWPASAIHPTHAAYPTAGGCISSTFDACGNLKPGESWSFKFDKVGVWNYHNHLVPGHRGAVTVIE